MIDPFFFSPLFVMGLDGEMYLSVYAFKDVELPDQGLARLLEAQDRGQRFFVGLSLGHGERRFVRRWIRSSMGDATSRIVGGRIYNRLPDWPHG